MATYVVSDIHGCFNTFRRLLDTLSFDETQDRLWLIGDIVNRGPASLSMLRWAQKHDHCLNMVLGNHDLHLLAVREGVVRACVHDTLAEVLAAPDADVLCEWLRRRPLAHAEGKWLLLHAGLLPDWNTNRALALAQEAATVIGGAHWRDFATEIYGDTPTRWDDSLSGNARWRTIVNVLTRLRICTPTGEMRLSYSGEVENTPSGYLPWFEAWEKPPDKTTVIFGHWSALGFYRRENLLCLDSGCLWGRQLTAMRLEDEQIFQVPAAEQ
ncbi:MAG: symmetrical bis(5'-nucleosyl)-tetraphosphatase [Candidatus Zeuxoniibacter abyssi]|nr:MAG: symmetrical bis(5'-nucleosyl)-tetraphosphatase [Candidatus Persebacteraceae bacterium AB1(2)]